MTEDSDAVITACLLARGLCDIYDRIVTEGASVQQDATLPASARRALARLSRQCVLEESEDLGSSIHLVMGKASRPMAQWGLACFGDGFRYSDVELADSGLGVPTEDCRELARLGGSEIDASENLHHEQLRAAVQAYPSTQRHAAYTTIREFVVRNPVVSLDALHRFIANGHVQSARTIAAQYRAIPQGAISGGKARRCGRCGSRLWPTSEPAFPHGRCHVRQCAAIGETVVGEPIDQPALYRLASAAVLAFWVGPGLDEIRLYDALKALGRKVALYPLSDASDVGLDGLDVGLDVKSYSSALVLGVRLSRGLGRLTMFERRVIVVPDYKLRLNPRYLDDLRGSYTGAESIEFMTVAGAIREFSP